MKNSAVIENRKVRFDYNIIETYTAGIILTGPEVCAIRAGHATIRDAYCYIYKNQLILTGMSVNIQSNVFNSDKRDNNDYVLLLTKKELHKIEKYKELPGCTVVPIKIQRNNKGLYKVIIGVCIGKREFDKRETIKDRDNKRALERAIKNY